MEEINRNIRVVKLLKQIMDSIKQHVDREFKAMNITGTQGMIVGTLAHQGEMKISELSLHMSLSNSTVSGILDRLEESGIVERTRSKDDRRVVYVRVTEEFKKKARFHFGAVENEVASFMKDATLEELDKVYEGLEILKDIIDRQKKSDS